eukprot:400319-Prorocentrum_minimum.AAC.1
MKAPGMMAKRLPSKLKTRECPSSSLQNGYVYNESSYVYFDELSPEWVRNVEFVYMFYATNTISSKAIEFPGRGISSMFQTIRLGPQVVCLRFAANGRLITRFPQSQTEKVKKTSSREKIVECKLDEGQNTNACVRWRTIMATSLCFLIIYK